MAEIKLVKKYPNIRDEDVTEIFQEGYLKGFENGRKNAISVEWIRSQKVDYQNKYLPFDYCRGMQDGFNDCY